ncbi:hypothetical protein U3516DRAFT_604429, partial [Neocallimastix sp. 'constans']
TTSINSIPTSTDDRCGVKFGTVCPRNECCSKYGYCGRSSDHCDVSKGCQSEFGRCEGEKKSTTTTTKKSLQTSTNGKCGAKYGICPKGQCCSKYGYCGKSTEYCGSGCQSEFGKCKNTTKTTKKSSKTTAKARKTSTNGRCGSKYGVCPKGECCSKYNYCGTSKDHCKVSRGCQSEFGRCK